MPTYILVEDMINDMIDEISYIKIKSHLSLSEE